MFTDAEGLELSSRLMLALEQNKAGRADTRKELADLLTQITREFLTGKYNTNFGQDNAPDGIVQTRDTIDKDDFRR